MATSNSLSVFSAPLPVANNVPVSPETNHMPVHVVHKIGRFPYEGEVGSYQSIEGFFSGISFKVIADPEKIESALRPLIEPTSDISGQWKMVNLAVLGGYYCTLGKHNEIRNPTGVIIRPSRFNKYGTIDISEPPNGLLYLLHLHNKEGRYQQVLYFDPQRALKEGCINQNTLISFPSGSKTPNLHLFADSGEETVGLFPFRKKILVARRPIGSVACYVSDDIITEVGACTCG